MFEVIITSKNFLLRNIEVHSLLNCYYVQAIHCSQRQGGWLDSSNSAISLQSQPVSQQRQRKATNQHLLQGQILYPLHGVRLQRMVQRQLLRQVRAIYFNMSSCLPYEVLLLLLLTEVFEDIVLRAFLETFITSTNVSRRLQGEVSQSIFAKNYIAVVLRKTLETYTELDQVAFVV